MKLLPPTQSDPLPKSDVWSDWINSGQSRHLWLQFLAVLVLQAVFLGLFLLGEARPSLFNAIWLVGLPFLIGLFSNRGVWRAVMTFTLIVWSFVSAMLLYAIELWTIGIPYN